MIDDSKKRQIAKVLDGLSKSEIDEVLKERRRIKDEKERAQIERTISNLRVRERGLKDQLSELRKEIRGLQSQLRSGSRTGRRGRGNVSGRSFEDLVMEVMQELPPPVRPRDVRNRILEKGWYEGEIRSLTASVAVTIRTLLEAGKLTKTNDRKYRLA